MNSSDVRSEMIVEFKKYMMGPHWGNEEIIDSPPKFTYMAGILFPQDSEIEQENVVTEVGDDSEPEVSDKSVLNSLNPSSFGLTCMLDKGTENIQVKIEYGIYLSQKNTETKQILYERHHFNDTFSIPTTRIFTKNLEISFGEIKAYFRKTKTGILCSVYLINTHKTFDSAKSKNIIFQPRIEIISEKKQIIHSDGNNLSNLRGLDDDLFDLIFERKRNFGFGHGCAVSWDDTEVDGKNIGRIWTDFIPEYEQKNIKHVDADGNLDSCVDMKNLSEVNDFSKYSDVLFALPNAYSKWIKEQLEDRIALIDNKRTAESQIKKCREAYERIKEGIQIISTDPVAGKAFQFMNKVMLIQRICSETVMLNQANNKFDPPIIENASGKWRLFQIGFILMNVKSFLSEKNTAKNIEGKNIDENNIRESREIADLLWFPTGGGKTEAYLGIIAFAMATRRLSAPKNQGVPDISAYGVSVLMRYTLRLLTIQQFQRAATLMCACEYVRRQSPDVWGTGQFLVGLWVGLSATPNTLRGLDDRFSAEHVILRSRKTGKIPEENNPMQLLNCPWCGHDLDAFCYEFNEDRDFNLPERLRLYCKNKKCFFHRNNRINSGAEVGIPILTVDEDIYKWCPSLLISTVDKFAQITWNEKIASLFGKVNKFCNKDGFLDNLKTGDHKKGTSDEKTHSYFSIEKLNPPDLIVQDELHLISGPMGTLTALYETAIDYFCKNKKRDMRPKIIASTATTKSASSQIDILFNRKETKVFPPQGFEFGKTFFSDVDLTSPGKIFLGISPTARSQLTILAMSAASFMRKIRHLKDSGISPDLLDPYYTLIAYFNSKRELGGAYGTFSDTVPDYFNQIFNNVEQRKSYAPTELSSLTKEEESKTEEEILAENPEIKYLDNKLMDFEELTSRQNSGEIPDILKKLSNPLPKALDYLLCTNMLSVGVDIQRLGLMIVNGQPKNHSEYIQATGRIGRKHPGLILTIYNSLKPRDLSHFENFKLYHSAFFKYVEPISITPFASRARDKGLFAICVGMLRNMVPLIAKEPGNFEMGLLDIRNAVSEIKAEFRKRVDETDRDQLEDTLQEIDDYLEAWAKHASKTSPMSLKYRSTSYTTKKERETTRFLLTTVEGGGHSLDGIPKSPMSLRDAEQMHDVYFYESLDSNAKDLEEDELEN
ncbi:MAG: DISARM system helicase DrmA [Nitrosarchaeum sp.]|nr:DISARM system helicase DrmA [Nitrosarchaeum sp.]